jgi:hypothetical protein
MIVNPPTSNASIRAAAFADWPLLAAGLALASGASLLCLRYAGPLQGVLFGACGTAVLLTPTLVAAGRSAATAAAVWIAASVGALAGPAMAFAGGDLNNPTFLAGLAVVPALAAAAAGLTLLFLSARVSPAVAGWLVTLLLLAWLGWPVWLSPWLPGREGWVDWLSPAHPLLTIDAALVRAGVAPWSEHRLMYDKLTVLGQHVFPRPPAGVGAAVWVHLVLAVPGFALVALGKVKRGRRRSSNTSAEKQSMLTEH